jgi:putative restriction endonuclease
VAYSESDYLDLTTTDAVRQWRSIADRGWAQEGKRQVDFVPVKTLLCLAAMYLVDHTRFGSSSASRAPEPVPQLAWLFKRPPSSILAKMANLDGGRSHGGKYDLLAGSKLRSDTAQMAATYRVVMSAARAAGIGPDTLPDFLHLEAGGEILLLGQDELDRDAVDSLVEHEFASWLECQPELAERDTVWLLLASVRVGQHGFAAGVLHNCGNAFVFAASLSGTMTRRRSCGLVTSSRGATATTRSASTLRTASRPAPRMMPRSTSGSWGSMAR